MIVAAMIRPGFTRVGQWVVYSVSYELTPSGAISAVWTHEKHERPRSTQERHIRWNPTDTIA